LGGIAGAWAAPRRIRPLRDGDHFRKVKLPTKGIGAGPIPVAPPSPDTPKPLGSQEPTKATTCETPGASTARGSFLWRVGPIELLDLLASAHHFPTPGYGWKGVMGRDHSCPRALLPARLGRLRHSRPNYPCAYELPHRFLERRQSLQNKRRERDQDRSGAEPSKRPLSRRASRKSKRVINGAHGFRLGSATRRD
jgi:hypothetical protein